MILDKDRVLEKIREYFKDPLEPPDLPNYILLTWTYDDHESFKTADKICTGSSVYGRIFDTTSIEEIRKLYLFLTSDSISVVRIYYLPVLVIARWIDEAMGLR